MVEHELTPYPLEDETRSEFVRAIYEIRQYLKERGVILNETDEGSWRSTGEYVLYLYPQEEPMVETALLTILALAARRGAHARVERRKDEDKENAFLVVHALENAHERKRGAVSDRG